MSEHAASALAGAAYDGIVSVSEMGLHGMVTLKADLSSDRTAGALQGAVGADMPDPRGIVPFDGGAVAWMAPDELLILCAHDKAAGVTADLAAKLAGQHHLAVEVSDARVMFEIRGAAVRDVLGKLTPADLSPGALGPGEMRRTRLAQVAAAIWFEDAQTVRLIAFRSVAQYVFDVLCTAARPGGEVGYHPR